MPGRGAVRDVEDGVELRVLVVPGASRPGAPTLHGDTVRLRVSAPPEGGRANRAVVELLAATLGVRPSDVDVVAGSTSRLKRIRVRGVAAAQVLAVVDAG